MSLAVLCAGTKLGLKVRGGGSDRWFCCFLTIEGFFFFFEFLMHVFFAR